MVILLYSRYKFSQGISNDSNLSVSPLKVGSHFLSDQEISHKLVGHLQKFDVIQPTPEGGDIGGDGGNVDALSAEDDTVLTLIGWDFDCPFDDLIKSLFVNGLAVVLIITLAGIDDKLIEVGIAQVIMVRI